MDRDGDNRPRRRCFGGALMAARENECPAGSGGYAESANRWTRDGQGKAMELRARLGRRVESGTNHDDPRQKICGEPNKQMRLARRGLGRAMIPAPDLILNYLCILMHMCI